MISKKLKKAPISAAVFSCDEGHLLSRFLESVSFCSEIVVFDCESKDNTRTVAMDHPLCIYKNVKRYAIKEEAVREYISMVEHDWVLLLDPDEYMPKSLQESILTAFELESADGAAVIMLPMHYYFGKKRLKGTFWGGIKYKQSMINKQRVTFNSSVHSGFIALGTYEVNAELFRNCAPLEHYWCRGWVDLCSKHLRYLSTEGKSRYLLGNSLTLKQLIIEPVIRFDQSYRLAYGYKDGLLGLELSIFYALYHTIASYLHAIYLLRILCSRLVPLA